MSLTIRLKNIGVLKQAEFSLGDWKSEKLLDDYQYRFVSISGININKQSTRFYQPRNQSREISHDSPDVFLEILARQSLYFGVMFGYGYRWVMPMDYRTQEQTLLDKLSPLEHIWSGNPSRRRKNTIRVVVKARSLHGVNNTGPQQ